MKNINSVDLKFSSKKNNRIGKFYICWVMLKLFPRRTLIILIALFISSVVEGFGLLTFLPLFEIIKIGKHDHKSNVSEIILSAFDFLGIELVLSSILIVMVTLIFCKSVISFAANTYVGKVMIDITTEIRNVLINKILSARWPFFIAQSTGKLVNSVSVEATSATNVYSHSIKMLANFFQVLVLLFFAFTLSPLMVVSAIVIGCFMFISLKYFLEMSRNAGKAVVKLIQSMTSIMTDALQGIKPIKVMDREKWLIPMLKKEIESIKKSLLRQVIAQQAVADSREPIIVAFSALGIYFALNLLLIPTSEILVLIILFHRTISGISTIQTSYQKVITFESFYWSIANFIKISSEEREKHQGTLIPTLEQSIKLENIFFFYDKKEVLSGISLEIPANSFSVLIGKSGSGKTTLVDILCGLYIPDSGKIYIDDVSLSEVSLQKWRSSIGYVPQDLFLFHDDICNNVTLGDTSISYDAVESALKSAGAWEFIKELPDGINTVLGERGARLSGGQRQRISIARALVRKPKLLILDEATTALDKETEREILTTLQSLVGDMTVMAISHQTALLDAADTVFQIHNGQVDKIK